MLHENNALVWYKYLTRWPVIFLCADIDLYTLLLIINSLE